jgi:hypothetical protein
MVELGPILTQSKVQIGRVGYGFAGWVYQSRTP